jgi:hypothetical protein
MIVAFHMDNGISYFGCLFKGKMSCKIFKNKEGYESRCNS